MAPNFLVLKKEPGAVLRVPSSTVLAATCAAIISLGLFLRAPDVLQNAQFVAEDGSTYFLGQLHHRLPQLLQPLQGYLVVLLRLVAWFASAFSLEQIPFVYVVSANLLAGACIGYFCYRARELFDSTPILGAVLLLPMVSGIMLDNLVHLQWFSQFVLVGAVILPRPATNASKAWRAGELAAITIAALTGPYALLCTLSYAILQGLRCLAALAGLRGVRDSLGAYLRSLDASALTITAGAAIVTVIIANSDNKIPLHFSAGMLGDLVPIIGEGLQLHMIGQVPIARSLFVTFQLALFGIVALLPDLPRNRAACVAVLLYGWLCLAAGYAKAKTLGTTAPVFNYGDTYFFALAVLQWLVVWRVASNLRFFSRTGATLLVILALSVGACSRPYLHVREAFPDMKWRTYASRIADGESVRVPIYPPPWTFYVASPPPQALTATTRTSALRADHDTNGLAGSMRYPGFNLPVWAPGNLEVIQEEGRQEIGLHSPTWLIFKPPPGPYEISATIGIQRAALIDSTCASANPDGIGASIILHHAGDETIAWHREIDPFHERLDRGPQRLRIASLNVASGDTIEYRVDPGHDGSNVACDWSYVRNLFFRRLEGSGSRTTPDRLHAGNFD